MRTLTLTLAANDTPMPPGSFSAFAGFQLTLTRAASGGTLVLPPENKLVWTIADLRETETYSLLVEMVDAAGAVIDTMPASSFTVPPRAASQTYPKVTGFTTAWD